MPTPDDERFETYLRQFRPLAPDALPAKERERTLPRYWLFGIWSAGAAALIILGLIGFRVIPSRVPGQPGNPQPVSVTSTMRPLTMRDANSVLTTAPSYKSALDEMAFHPQRSTVPKDQQSAVAVLSKEKIRL
ncbi:MAG TPA: hypothetical protein VFM77_11375 [Terriglobales bacterium]|nr:hypothetical protein [Terriglobales bacterium]